LSEWLKACNLYGPEISYAETAEDRAAVSAVRTIGTNAVPFLLKWIRHESPDWRYRLHRAVCKLPSFISESSLVEKVTADRAEDRARNAQMGFAVLGALASNAVPELVKLLDVRKCPDTGSRAMWILGDLGPDGIAALIRRIESTNGYGGTTAIKVLSHRGLGTNALAAVPFLIRFVASEDEEDAVYAAEMLGNLKIEPEIVVPSLTSALRYSNAPVEYAMNAKMNRQQMAAYALARFGRQATLAVPSLLKLAQDSEGYTYHLATNALGKIAPEVLANER